MIHPPIESEFSFGSVEYVDVSDVVGGCDVSDSDAITDVVVDLGFGVDVSGTFWDP